MLNDEWTREERSWHGWGYWWVIWWQRKEDPVSSSVVVKETGNEGGGEREGQEGVAVEEEAQRVCGVQQLGIDAASQAKHGQGDGDHGLHYAERKEKRWD